MSQVRQNRNETVDILRGVAMLLVILQHTMSGCTVGSENSFLFQVAWSVQMPLFFLISGYVTRYSKAITSAGDLWKYIKKRTCAYLLPWVVWTFGVRGLVFGQTGFFNIRNLLWHMDSGYWFLFSLWTISLIFGFSRFLARTKQEIKETATIAVTFACGMLVLAIIGAAAGMSFLCIKLTLYYMPFFFLGYVYGQYGNRIKPQIWEMTIAVSLGIWLAVLTRVDLYTMDETLMGIGIRAISSLMGCIAVSGLVSNAKAIPGGGDILKAVGQHSLEIYLVHYLLLNLVRREMVTYWGTLYAGVLTAVNYLLTIALSLMIMKLLNSNAILRKVLFGKG